MDKKIIEALKTLRELGASYKELFDIMTASGAKAEATPASDEPEEAEVRSARVLKAVDIGLDFDKAVSLARMMTIGDRLSAFEIVYRLINRVPDTKADRRACTNFLQQVPGLRVVSNGNGAFLKGMSAWGQSPLFERVKLLEDGRS